VAWRGGVAWWRGVVAWRGGVAWWRGVVAWRGGVVGAVGGVGDVARCGRWRGWRGVVAHLDKLAVRVQSARVNAAKGKAEGVHRHLVREAHRRANPLDLLGFTAVTERVTLSASEGLVGGLTQRPQLHMALACRGVQHGRRLDPAPLSARRH